MVLVDNSYVIVSILILAGLESAAFICKNTLPNCSAFKGLIGDNICKSEAIKKGCQKLCGVCSDTCPCSCDYKRRLDFWKAKNIIDSNRTAEILKEYKTKSERIKRELQVNKKNISSFLRRKNSAKDSRRSAKSIGQFGAVILVVFFVSIILLDFCPRYNNQIHATNV